MHPLIVHCKKSKYDIYIGRPSKWGNPFIIGKDGTREEVIQKYKNYILNNPKLLEDAKRELKGKILGCWCAPQHCHGEILVEIANSIEKDIFEACTQEKYYIGQKCPRCGNMMILVQNSFTGHHFVGCSNFPKCDTCGEIHA